MISCKRAAALISLSLDGSLGVRRWLALRVHLAACGMCRRFLRQARLLDHAGELAGAASDQATNSSAQLPQVTLPESARQRIQSAFNEQTGDR